MSGSNDSADKKQYRAGVFQGGTPDTARDISFYDKKRETEKHLGRELSIEEFRENYYQPDAIESTASGTSIFDPVLVELACRWFCPPGGNVLDPFAGGSVRGIVASKLGLHYTGIDLSARQIEANKVQGAAICDPEFMPRWINGNSLDVETLVPGLQADFIFSCPPYADLEVYSTDSRDLSNMPYPQFREMYGQIIAAAVRMLRLDRFACFVVGDIRDGDGFYRNFPAHTVEAFEAAGARFYNSAILVTAVGSLPVRITRQFNAARKLGKTHQDVLVFCKGDPKKATQAIGNDGG